MVYPEGSLGHGDGSIVDLSICGCQIAKAEGVGPWDGESTLSIPAGTISSTNTCFSSGTSYLEALGREDSSTKSLILTDAYHYVLAIQLLLGGTPNDKLVWLVAHCIVHTDIMRSSTQLSNL